jgi:predicted transcriptional regulator
MLRKVEFALIGKWRHVIISTPDITSLENMSQDNIYSNLVPPKDQKSQVERRSRMETYCDILRAISTGAQKPTHILYKANLSWTAMEEQIEDLESRGLVEYLDDDGRKVYRLSDKGFKLLGQFLSLREDLRLARRE